MSADIKTIILNHLSNLKSIQSSGIEYSSDQLNIVLESIRSQQNYYIKLTESYVNNYKSLNGKIASKLTKIKIQLLKTKNEQRLFLLKKNIRNKNNFNQNLNLAIKNLKELSLMLQ